MRSFPGGLNGIGWDSTFIDMLRRALQIVKVGGASL